MIEVKYCGYFYRIKVLEYLIDYKFCFNKVIMCIEYMI